MSSPRTSKTVLGTLRFARVPRTVFEVLGLDIPQGPSENRGTLAHYTPVLPVLLLRGGQDISQGNFIKRGTLGQKVGDIEKQSSQCPTFSELGDIGNQ